MGVRFAAGSTSDPLSQSLEAVILPIEGRETKVYKAGEAIQIPPETPHAGGKPPAENDHLMTNYIVEKKGKLLIKFV
jgi:hypothetical protein